MAIETDFFSTTVTTIKVIETQNWPTAFAVAPIAVSFSTEDKKKSGVENVTTTDFDVSCETLNLHIMACTPGYAAEVADVHPERDAGVENITTAKTFQSFTFNSTFSTAPIVIAGYEGSTAGGKKVSVGSITTTGGDITDENGDFVNWIAIVPGAFP